MPTNRRRTPDTYVPDDPVLLALAQRHPGVSLRALAARIWPDLPWSGGTGADSATGRERLWQVPPRPGVAGNRVERLTAARWLSDRLADLIALGLLCHGPRLRGEVDALAGLTYLPSPMGAPTYLTHARS